MYIFPNYYSQRIYFTANAFTSLHFPFFDSNNRLDMNERNKQAVKMVELETHPPDDVYIQLLFKCIYTESDTFHRLN